MAIQKFHLEGWNFPGLLSSWRWRDFFFFLESWSKKIERERKGSALFEMETGRGDNSRKQNLIKANTAIATSEMTDTEFFGSVDKYYFFLFEDFIEDPARFHLVFFAASFSSALGIFSQCWLPTAPSSHSPKSFSMASGLGFSLWAETGQTLVFPMEQHFCGQLWSSHEVWGFLLCWTLQSWVWKL